MNLNKLIAALLSLSFVAGAVTNMDNYAPNYQVTANAEDETVAVTTTAAVTTAVTTTKAAVTTTAKSSTTAITSVVTSITSSTTTPVAKDIISGDVNNDGRIDAIDASTILSHYALISTNKKGILTEAQIKNVDINNDGITLTMKLEI